VCIDRQVLSQLAVLAAIDEKQQIGPTGVGFLGRQTSGTLVRLGEMKLRIGWMAADGGIDKTAFGPRIAETHPVDFSFQHIEHRRFPLAHHGDICVRSCVDFADLHEQVLEVSTKVLGVNPIRQDRFHRNVQCTTLERSQEGSP
jgi:hypothetical protein